VTREAPTAPWPVLDRQIRAPTFGPENPSSGLNRMYSRAICGQPESSARREYQPDLALLAGDSTPMHSRLTRERSVGPLPRRRPANPCATRSATATGGQIAEHVRAVDLAVLSIDAAIAEFEYLQPPSGLPAVLSPDQAAAAAQVLRARRAAPNQDGTFHKQRRYISLPDPESSFAVAAGGGAPRCGYRDRGADRSSRPQGRGDRRGGRDRLWCPGEHAVAVGWCRSVTLVSRALR
jgi:hypothetical protein